MASTPPSGHQAAQWFADQVAARGKAEEQIHIRGVHYATAIKGNVQLPRPIRKIDNKTKAVKYEATVYQNDDPCWEWLVNEAASAARWLKYLPFEALADKWNAKPNIRNGRGHAPPEAKIALDLEVYLPDPEDLHPRAAVAGFKGRQPYRLVVFGEKASLDPIVTPIADRYDADVFLVTGEISSTLVYEMCKAGAEDGRPMIIFTLSDFDPSGWQMPVSIARKVQAYRDLFFNDLQYEIRPVALLFDQVKELNLPSTPLKESEKRGDAWREVWGREQTEIDAVIELRPDVLREQLTAALDQFYDRTLERRVTAAAANWEAQGPDGTRR